MQQMKAAWKKMPEDEQNYWRERLGSTRMLADTAEEILEKLKIKLNPKYELTHLRIWIADQDARIAQAERMQENEVRLRDQHPDWSVDRVRREVFRQAYYETLASGDYKLGLSAAKVELSEKNWELRREKHEFDASTACLKKLPELKLISNNPKLTDREKINQIRRKLFGELPEDAEQEKAATQISKPQ